MAYARLITLPVLVVFAAFQRSFVASISGSGKGVGLKYSGISDLGRLADPELRHDGPIIGCDLH
jgi:hypothetical protein